MPRPFRLVLLTAWVCASLAAISVLWPFGRSHRCASEVARQVLFADENNRAGLRAMEAFRKEIAERGVDKRHCLAVVFSPVDMQAGQFDRQLLRSGVASPAAVVASSEALMASSSRVFPGTPVIYYDDVDPERDPARSRSTHPLVTGITDDLAIELKLAEFLALGYPTVRRLGIIANEAHLQLSGMKDLQKNLFERFSMTSVIVTPSTLKDTERALTTNHGLVDGWLVLYTEVVTYWPEETIALVEATKKPAIFAHAKLAEMGALMAYGPYMTDSFLFGSWSRQLDALLSGVAPATIPIQRPYRFRLTVNADALGRTTVPPSREFLRRAQIVATMLE